MNGKKVLVTGAKGMLGTSIVERLKFNYLSTPSSREMDITSLSRVKNVLDKERPDIIIHSAAYTDVDSCEENIDRSYKVNTLGTQNLVNYCIGKNILFVFISSTGIYGDWKNNHYSEFDEAKPLSVHHKTKYQAEKIIQSHLNKYLILRTGWLYGGDHKFKKNFVHKRLIEAKSCEVMYADKTQIGNPTFTNDVVDQMKILIDNQYHGIFNCVNKANFISRFDYVSAIIELCGINCKVKIAPKKMFHRKAPVSHNESAINYKLDLLGINIMPEWKLSLNRYIDKIRNFYV